MSRHEFRIEAFPKGLWRLDYFGAIENSPEVPSERQINVGLSPVIDPAKNPLHNGAVNIEEQCVLPIQTGLLPFLAIGTVWNDGEIALGTGAPQQTQLTIDTELAKVISPVDTIPDPFGNDTAALPRSTYQFGRKLFRQAIRHTLIALPVSGGHDEYEVIIPSVELMRFYLCTHDVLARTLFLGEWNDLIWDGGTHDLPNNGIEVGLNSVRGLTYDAAFILGRYLKSDHMRREVDRIINSIQRSFPKLEPAIESQFPFAGKTELSVSYKGMSYKGRDADGKEVLRWRKFITRIHSCTHPFPFGDCHPNPKINPAQGKNADDESLPPIAIPPKGPSPKVQGGKKITSTPTEPQIDIEVTKLVVEENRFAFLAGKTAALLPKEAQKYRHVRPPLNSAGEGDRLGTGEGRGGGSETNPMSVTPSRNPPAPPSVELVQFLQAIVHLRTMADQEYQVNSIVPLSVDTHTQAAGEAIFPLSVIARGALGHHTHRRWRWLHVVGAKPRHIAVVQVVKDGRYVYLFDLERKIRRGKSEALVDEKFSVLACRMPRGEALSRSELMNLLAAIIWNRGWPRRGDERFSPDLYPLKFLNMTHHHSIDTQAFARRLHSQLLAPLFS